MKPVTKKVLSLMLALVFVALMVAGCQPAAVEPEPTEEPAAPADPATPADPAAPAEPAPTEDPDAAKFGGTMVLGETRTVIQPNFIFYSSTIEGRLRDLVFDKLFTTDPNLEIVPRLAESYETEDNQTWTIHLRQGVKWSDGEDFTADDVVFGINFYNSVTTTTKSDTLDCEIVKIDDYTVQFILPAPDVGFLYSNLVEYVAWPEHVWKDVDPAQFDMITDVSYLVGTGPFKIISMNIDEEVVMERNELYWDGPVYLDGIVVRIIPDADAITLAFENGEIDLMRPSDETLVTRMEGTPGFNSSFYPSGNMAIMMINHTDPILSDVKVRQALSYLCNREALMVVDGAATGEVMTTCFTSGDVGYNPAAANGKMGVYDPTAAAALLDEAGWVMGADGIREKDGQKLHIELMVRSADGAMYQILIEDCKAVGVDLALRVVDKVTRNAIVFTFGDPAEKDFDLYINYMTIGPNALGYAAQYCDSNGYLCYSNPAVTEAFEKAAASKDFESAQVYFDEIQKLMTDDVAAIWLYSARRGWVSNNYLNTDDCGMTGIYTGWVNIGAAYFEQH